jgi:hypothetical protein
MAFNPPGGSSNAATSNSKLFNDVLKRQTGLSLAACRRRTFMSVFAIPSLYYPWETRPPDKGGSSAKRRPRYRFRNTSFFADLLTGLQSTTFVFGWAVNVLYETDVNEKMELLEYAGYYRSDYQSNRSAG